MNDAVLAQVIIAPELGGLDEGSLDVAVEGQLVLGDGLDPVLARDGRLADNMRNHVVLDQSCGRERRVLNIWIFHVFIA